MNLYQFQVTGRDTANLATVIPDQGLEGRAGRIYAGDAFIEGDAANGYCLTLNNESWAGELAKLESILYVWCLTECPDNMDVSDDLSLALANVANATSLETLASIIAEPREDSGSCALLDDSCDINECAIQAWSSNHGVHPHDIDVNSEAVETLIGEAYEFVSWNDYATDNARSNGPRA